MERPAGCYQLLIEDNATATAARLARFYRDAEYIPLPGSIAHASIDGPIRTMRIRVLCVWSLFQRVGNVLAAMLWSLLFCLRII